MVCASLEVRNSCFWYWEKEIHRNRIPATTWSGDYNIHSGGPENHPCVQYILTLQVHKCYFTLSQIELLPIFWTLIVHFTMHIVHCTSIWELGLVTGQIRRSLSVDFVRAQALCLFSRLAHLGEGAQAAAQRRQQAGQEEEGRRREQIAHYIAHIKGTRGQQGRRSVCPAVEIFW